LTSITENVFTFKDIEQAFDKAKGLKDVVVVFSALSDTIRDTLTKRGELKYLWLPFETNTIGLIKNGIKYEMKSGKNVFFFGKDHKKIRERFPEAFVICATPFEIEETEKIDLLIATKDGFEREGTFYNLEGKSLKRNKALESEYNVIDVIDLLSELSGKTKSEVI
jgi:formate dehydrogenase major subunit